MFWPAMISFIFIVGITAVMAVGAICQYHHLRRPVSPLPTTVDSPLRQPNYSIMVIFQQLIRLLNCCNRQDSGSRQTPGSHPTCSLPMPTVEVTVELAVDSEPLPEMGILQVMTSPFPPSNRIPEPESAFWNPYRNSRNTEITCDGRLCGDERL